MIPLPGGAMDVQDQAVRLPDVWVEAVRSTHEKLQGSAIKWLRRYERCDRPANQALPWAILTIPANIGEIYKIQPRGFSL